MESNRPNLDRATVDDFGGEWQRFPASIGLWRAGRSELSRLGGNVANWPLGPIVGSATMPSAPTALYRFATRLEHRMTQAQIKALIKNAGLCEIRFSNVAPFGWP